MKLLKLVIAYFCLASSISHAFWPLPTSRDILVAGGAAIATFSLVRTYYLGQEKRLTAAIQKEANATKVAVQQEAKETRSVIKQAGEEFVQNLNDTRQALQGQLGNIDQTTQTLRLQNNCLGELMMLMLQNQEILHKTLCGSSEPLALPAPGPRYGTILATFSSRLNLQDLQKAIAQKPSFCTKVTATAHEPKMIPTSVQNRASGSIATETSYMAGIRRFGNVLLHGYHPESEQ